MKKLLLFATLLLAFAHLQAQYEESEEKKGFDKNKLFVGGNFGLSFGDYTLINVSPLVGYRFNKYLAAGGGVNFLYSSERYRYTIPEYRQEYGVVGLNVFGRVYPIQWIFAQIQPELNYVWSKYKFYDGTADERIDPKFVPSLIGGLGGVIPMGRGAMVVMIQYDLLQQSGNPYGNQIFWNIGYNMGF